jgi:hypothetical protein
LTAIAAVVIVTAIAGLVVVNSTTGIATTVHFSNDQFFVVVNDIAVSAYCALLLTQTYAI